MDRLDKLDNKKLNWNEWFAKKFTRGIIGLKYKLRLGINNDNLELAMELHKPIRHKFKRRRVLVYNIDDIWTADLMDEQKLSKYNKGYRYLLTVIDTFSKYAYVVPLKTKSSQEVIDAFEKLFHGHHPNKLWTDEGTEFKNTKFKQFLKENNVELYHVYNEGKASIAERFNRTLGNMIARHLTATNSKNYINVLQKLIDDYNNRTHSSIKMTPHEATNPENRDIVFNNLYKNYDPVSTENPKFKVGDRVRIYAYQYKFDKATTTPRWTKEIFVISDIKMTDPITYKITDLNGDGKLDHFMDKNCNTQSFKVIIK